MNINLITLNTQGKVDFEGPVSFEDYTCSEIKEMKDMCIRGNIIDNSTEDYELTFHLTGTLVLKSAINGSDVDWPIAIDFDEFVPNLVENYKKSTNSLDILPILWENILLEIPIRAVNENDEFLESAGDGWEILEQE